MKNMLKICVVIFTVMFACENVWSADNCNIVACPAGLTPEDHMPGCILLTCYGPPNGLMTFAMCNKCASGYNSEPYTHSECNVKGYECKKICKPCTNCETEPNWTTYAPGYERRIERRCSCEGDCTESTVYRCAAGYYGYPAWGGVVSGCALCSTATSNPRATSDAGMKFITNCFLPSGTTGSDTPGTYRYSDTCYYSN